MAVFIPSQRSVVNPQSLARSPIADPNHFFVVPELPGPDPVFLIALRKRFRLVFPSVLESTIGSAIQFAIGSQFGIGGAYMSLQTRVALVTLRPDEIIDGWFYAKEWEGATEVKKRFVGIAVLCVTRRVGTV